MHIQVTEFTRTHVELEFEFRLKYNHPLKSRKKGEDARKNRPGPALSTRGNGFILASSPMRIYFILLSYREQTPLQMEIPFVYTIFQNKKNNFYSVFRAFPLSACSPNN